MAEALVRGVAINYATFGTAGPWVALLPGSRRSYAELVPMARRLAARGFRVLLHDRRNCGASEVAIEGDSEHAVWADDLHGLAAHLGILPCYFGGASSGARTALLVALRHPEAVRGLLLWRVTGGQKATEKLAETYYGSFIKMVDRGGMEAVCRSDHFSEGIDARPSNRDKLLTMDPAEFVAVMERWREDFLRAAALPVVGATEAQLRALACPVSIIAGNDQIHPPQTARRAASLIPRAELHDDVVSRRSEDDLLEAWDQDEWRSKEEDIVSIFTTFMQRAEAADAAPVADRAGA